MPRHRRERVPLYGTRRRAVQTARRVQLSAAVQAPVSEATTLPPTTLPSATLPPTTEPVPTEPSSSAASSAEPSTAAEVTATAPLPAFRRHLLQVSSPAGPTAFGGTSAVARATRRLMVTPWFAVATGFVVAAGVWIYSPHATLKFPVGKGGEQPCYPPECTSTGRPNLGVPNSAAQKPVTYGKSATKFRTPSPRDVTWRVLARSDGRILLLIKITGKHVPRTWHLTFVVPGLEITGVVGAHWQHAGISGGTASWPTADAPRRDAGSAGSYRSGYPWWFEPGKTFVVVGTGVEVTPDYCSFDKSKCTFTFVATPDERGWPSGLQSH